MIFQEIFKKIKDSNSIAIFTHIKPDGDCLGSGMALYYVCKKMGKDVQVFNSDVVHKNFNFLVNGVVKNKMEQDYDLYVSVDCPSSSKLGTFESKYLNKTNTINIDHHITNSNFANLNYVDAKASSCCEIIYEFLIANNQELDSNVARAIMCGLSSDTGCFKHSNTSSKSHLLASELLKYDFDLEELNYYLFKIRNKKSIKLYAKAMNNLQCFKNDRIAIAGLTLDDFKYCDATFEDKPSIVDDLSGIEGVDVGISYIQDADKGFYISFRTTKDVKVNEIAEEFGGGGHIKAAGCKIFATKDKLIEMLNKKASKYLND